jgi:hypothetical protein
VECFNRTYTATNIPHASHTFLQCSSYHQADGGPLLLSGITSTRCLLLCVPCRCLVCCAGQVLDPGGRRSSPQLALFEELVIRAYLAVSDPCHGCLLHCFGTLFQAATATCTINLQAGNNLLHHHDCAKKSCSIWPGGSLGLVFIHSNKGGHIRHVRSHGCLGWYTSAAHRDAPDATYACSLMLHSHPALLPCLPGPHCCRAHHCVRGPHVRQRPALLQPRSPGCKFEAAVPPGDE